MTDILAAAGRSRRRILSVPGGIGSVATGLALWRPAGPSAGPVPSDAMVVTVTPVPGSPPGTGLDKLDRAFTVADPAKVAAIAAVIDGLGPLPQGMDACRVDRGATMRLAFRASAAGPVAARVTAGYGCQLVSVSGDGQTVLLPGDSSGSGQLSSSRSWPSRASAGRIHPACRHGLAPKADLAADVFFYLTQGCPSSAPCAQNLDNQCADACAVGRVANLLVIGSAS